MPDKIYIANEKQSWTRHLTHLWYIVPLAFVFLSGKWSSYSAHTSVVEIVGVIEAGNSASSEHINQALEDAFESSGTKGVVLHINSPGGSPVQSDEIYSEVKRLRGKYPHIPVYAACADMCASGGYYIASAADQIVANRASIVGSIGVAIDGFGYTNALEKLGVERRSFTAGAHKRAMDPFTPLDDWSRDHTKTLLKSIHGLFVESVTKGRGDRLTKNEPDLFEGAYWTGEQAKAIGLIDGFGNARQVARQVFKAPDIVTYRHKGSFLDSLTAKAFVNAVVNELAAVRVW